MSSIAVSRKIIKADNNEAKETFIKRIGKYILETSEIMAPGMFTMNNTYYRPSK